MPLANTITPLMSAQCAYLFVLNLLIGIFEAFVLKRLFRGGRHATWWMIAANYASAWAGMLGLAWLSERYGGQFLGPRPIERINRLAVATVSLAFVITLIIEAGFVHVATAKPQRSIRRTLLATICVNLLSYGFICLWFLSISYSLPLNARISNLADLGSLPEGSLYWVDPAGDVRVRRLSDPSSERIAGHVVLNSRTQPYQLRFVPASAEGHAQLEAAYSYLGDVPSTEPSPFVLRDAGLTRGLPEDYWDQSRFLRKSVLDLRPPAQRRTQVGFDWYRTYLDTAVPDGPRSHLHMGLASTEWRIQEPTVLPDEKIIFEWAGQILVFDPHDQRLAFIARGSCPAFLP